MDQSEKKNGAYYTIDMLRIVGALISRMWIIIISGFLVAVTGFSIATLLITPKYSASIMLYVNNSSFSLGNTSFSISSSEITAAQSLVKTYGEILDNRTTLERIITKAELPYDYEDLSKMILAEPSNDTEIMRVTVTSTDPYEAARIANCIAEVLPVRISEIIDGASMEVVDSAIPRLQKVAPSITMFTLMGFIIGVFTAAFVLAIFTIMDDTIYDEEYVLQTYNYPILAKVPNLLHSENKRYGYYYSQKKLKEHS